MELRIYGHQINQVAVVFARGICRLIGSQVADAIHLGDLSDIVGGQRNLFGAVLLVNRIFRSLIIQLAADDVIRIRVDNVPLTFRIVHRRSAADIEGKCDWLLAAVKHGFAVLVVQLAILADGIGLVDMEAIRPGSIPIVNPAVVDIGSIVRSAIVHPANGDLCICGIRQDDAARLIRRRAGRRVNRVGLHIGLIGHIAPCIGIVVIIGCAVDNRKGLVSRLIIFVFCSVAAHQLAVVKEHAAAARHLGDAPVLAHFDGLKRLGIVEHTVHVQHIAGVKA